MSSRLPDLIGRLRGLFRRPGYLLMATLTLALGLAAMVGAFIPVNGLLLRPSDFPFRDRLVVYGTGGSVRMMSPQLYELVGTPPEITSRGTVGAAESVNVQMGGAVVLLRAQRVDAGFLPTLGVQPFVGELPSGDREEAMLSWNTWRTRFAADPNVIGRTISVNGERLRVRGILPSTYRFWEDIDLVLPMRSEGTVGALSLNLMAVARLVPDASAATFAKHVNEVAIAHAERLHISSDKAAGYGASPLLEQMTADARPVLLLLVGCGVLVLAIAGLNLSALMYVRSMSTVGEVTLRITLGAHGYRLWLPGVGEAIVIGALASFGGLALGTRFAEVLARFLARGWFAPEIFSAVDWHVRLFTVIVAFIVLVLASLSDPVKGRSQEYPGHRSHRADLTGGVTGHARRMVTVVQAALATMLLILGLGMMDRWWHLQSTSAGFDAKHSIVFDIAPDTRQYPTRDTLVTLFDALGRRLSTLPGVDRVGTSNLLPGAGRFVMPFTDRDGRIQQIQYGFVTPGALDAMGLVLVSGRRLADIETVPVALVNQAYATAFDGDDVARPAVPRIYEAPIPIIGILGDTRQFGPAREPSPTVFLPLSQVSTRSFDTVRPYMSMHVFLRGPGVEQLANAAIDAAVHDVAPGLAVANVRTMKASVNGAMEGPLRDALLSSAFALAAVALACIGLYSSQSVDVAARRNEFALMSALGATPTDLFGTALSRGCGPAFFGVAVGLAAAAWLAGHGWLERSTDWRLASTTVVASVSIAMIVMTLAAGGIPALRAFRTDPLHVIR